MHLFINAFKEKSADRAVTLPTWLAPEVINEEEYTEKSEILKLYLLNYLSQVIFMPLELSCGNW